jgi:hypothetical protein
MTWTRESFAARRDVVSLDAKRRERAQELAAVTQLYPRTHERVAPCEPRGLLFTGNHVLPDEAA